MPALDDIDPNRCGGEITTQIDAHIGTRAITVFGNIGNQLIEHQHQHQHQHQPARARAR